jgi:hypothetical protein
MRLIVGLLLAAVIYGQTATFTKLADGGVSCSGTTTPGFESWNFGSQYSTDLQKVVVLMRDNCSGMNIYANSVWSVNSSTGALTHVASLNTGGNSNQCPPSGVTPYSRHSYDGTSWTNGLLFFGFGACTTDFADLWSLNTTTGAFTSKTQGASIGTRSEHAFGSDGSKILLFGGLKAGTEQSDTWLYDSANEAAGFVAQHPTTCTGTGCFSGGSGTCSAADTSCPPSSRSFAMEYDAINGVYVLFGGRIGGSWTKQVWAYSPATKAWTRKADAPAAVPVQARPLWVYNRDLRQFVLYSPTTVNNPGAVYTYDYAMNKWTLWNTNINGPVVNVFSGGIADGVSLSIAYDRSAKRVVLVNAYNGAGSGTASPEVWTLEFPSTLQIIGKGCSTAYYIDKDCDGYGVGVRVDGDYLTVGNIGDKADADDNDATVNTAATTLSKYGSIAAFLAARGYPSTASRIWYIAPTGNDTDCASNPNDVNHPCLTTAPFRAAAYNNAGSPGAGGTILYRGGMYNNYGINATGSGPTYYPTAGSASSPIVFMAYPGETPLISRAGANFDTSATDGGSWPGNTAIKNVILDGLAIKSPTGAGDCINGIDWDAFILRNLEVTRCADGLRANDHIENLTIEDSVWHDNVQHDLYLGYSSPTAVPHTLGQDFDFDQDAINYAGGTSAGASQTVVVQRNLSYRSGSSGYEPFHFNTYLRYLTLESNIIHSANNAAISAQTALYNSAITNNLTFNNGGCAANFWFYGDGAAMATMRWVTIQNNTMFAGNRLDRYNSLSGGTGQPGCGIRMSDGTTASANTDHWFKDFIIRNNIFVTDNWNTADTTSTIGSRPFEFLRNSYPSTHTIQNNLIYNNGTLIPFNATTDQVMEIAAEATVPAGSDGWYTFAQFAAFNASWTGNVYADPLFNNASLNYGSIPQVINLRLTSGSPGINAGTTVGAPAQDILGLYRNGSPDVGAYESGGVETSASSSHQFSGSRTVSGGGSR